MPTLSKRPPKQKPNADRQAVAMRHVSTLLPSPENSLLYRERNIRKPDRKRLVQSIRKTKGVQAPLLIALDDFIVSGHERHAAAPEAGFPIVPTIVLDLRRSNHTADEWLAVLREHNTGREKTQDEKIREKICESTTHSMRDEFHINNVSSIRVAMTHQQADEQGVSQSADVMTVKTSSVTPN